MPSLARRVLLGLAVVALASCGGGGGDAAPTAEVTIRTFQFAPDPLEVEAGTTITFRNEDKINHSVTAGTRDVPTPEVFDGLLEDAGTSFELTLDEPGTYDYFCSFHPGEGMTGQVVVS